MSTQSRRPILTGMRRNERPCTGVVAGQTRAKGAVAGASMD